MNADPPTIRADDSVAEAARVMTERNVVALPVLYGDKLVALVSERDLVQRVMAAGGGLDEPVIAVASGEPTVVAPDDDVELARHLMLVARQRSLPVVEDGVVVGLLADDDLAKRRTLRSRPARDGRGVSSADARRLPSPR